MGRKPDPFLLDDDNPEWTAEDFGRAHPIQEVDPGMLKAVAKARKHGRPPVEKVLREALAQGKL